MKLLLWLVIGLLVVWLLRKKTLGAPDALHNVDDPAKASYGKAESMIQCAHCRVHIPASESVVDASGSVFCSEEHSRLHATRA